MVPSSLLVFAPLAIASLLAGWGIVGVWLAIVALIAARFVLGGLRVLGEDWAHSDG
jgi:Na+-driven multidrug efflux pump